MEQLRKIWKQVDRRSLLTILVVGAIALGFVFPLKPADLSEQLAITNQNITIIGEQLAIDYQSIISTDQQVSLLIAEMNGMNSRLAQLEAKSGEVPELQELEDALASLETALASIKGTTARLQAFDFILSNLTERVVQLEAGGVGYDSAFKNDVLERLDALEDALDVEPSPSANHTITYSFDAGCSWHPVYGLTFYGQQFPTKSWDFDVSSVSMYLKRFGSPTEAVISLYSTGSTGFPEGVPLWTKTVEPGSWSSKGKWKTFTVTGVVLPDHSEFVLSVACPSGDENNNIKFGYHADGDYSGGGLVGTPDGGSAWTVTPDTDLGFVIYGERDY